MTSATSSTSTQTRQMPPPAALLELMLGGMIAGAVACLAQIGIPDLIGDGPKSAAELASKIGADPDALYRLMRATASVGILAETAEGKFRQTDLSDVLRSDATPSLKDWAIMQWRHWHTVCWTNLEYCVRTGKQAPEKFLGATIFDYLARNAEEGAIFNGAMTSLSEAEGAAIVGSYSFESFQSIVDIGGGHGSLLAAILARHPHLKGTLFDMPHVVEGAKSGPLKAFPGSCSFVGGNMFESAPSGADAYIMKYVIHDWADSEALKILRACRKGVNPGGKLLVVDAVIQPGNDFSFAKFIDVEMLIFAGGRERSEQQFIKLFAEAGWRFTQVIPTAGSLAIIEAVPA